jgi:serine/threonine-protein kinase
MIGQTISHYNILEKLGEGGMGQVYLAEDTSLNRKVALKFLPPHMHEDELAHKRFLREAESAAALDHPYICHINEVSQTDTGQDFIVMEYVEGQTLKDRLAEEPLSFEEAIRISREVTDALEMAHERGIVHRDLKPANIMLTEQGHAKVMDFGLAKKVVTGKEAPQDLTSGLTREGSTLGTPAYMSPEQVKAQQVDHRSDIFSFGIILYEMLTGVHPFRRARPVETMGAILHETPERLAGQIPGATTLLQKTVDQLLEKNPDQRIQTIGEVASRLSGLSSLQEEPGLLTFLRSRLGQRLTLAIVAALTIVLIGWCLLQFGPISGGPVVSSLAVLPLTNLSGDPEQEFFVDAMTEALITDLSKIGALRVTASSSVMRYKGSDKLLPEIAEELNVEAVVEGSVWREADRVRINARLIEAETERNLWADGYERDATSVLALQGEVAQAIAREIQVTLTPEEKLQLTRAQMVNPEAYEDYLKGQFHYGKLTDPDLETALQYFELALEKDPNYALAEVGRAMVWAGKQQMHFVSASEAGPKAREAAERAVELDENLAEAHYALAVVKTWTDWDWEGAEDSYRRSIELDPNFADVRAYYANYLMMMGRFDDAAIQMERALELDPFRDLFQALNAVLLRKTDRHDEAIEVYRNILKTVPNHPMALRGLFEAFFEKGMYEEATDALKDFAASKEDFAAAETLERGFAEGGFREAMRQDAERRAAGPTLFYGLVATQFAMAGENQKALEWLERACEERDPILPYVGVSDAYWKGGLHDEPRFQDLLRRMNFPEDAIARILDDSE